MEHLEKFVKFFNNMIEQYIARNNIIMHNPAVSISKESRLFQFANHAARYELSQCEPKIIKDLAKYLSSINKRYIFKYKAPIESDPLICMEVIDTVFEKKTSIKYFKHWTKNYKLKLVNGKFAKGD